MTPFKDACVFVTCVVHTHLAKKQQAAHAVVCEWIGGWFLKRKSIKEHVAWPVFKRPCAEVVAKFVQAREIDDGLGACYQRLGVHQGGSIHVSTCSSGFE